MRPAAASTACTRGACGSRSSSAGRAMFPRIRSTRHPSSAGSTGSPRSAASPRGNRRQRFDGEDVSGIWLGKDRTHPAAVLEDQHRPQRYRHPRRQLEVLLPIRNRGETELYDLSVDRAESTNVAAKHPDVVKELTAKVEKWKATLPRE